jgi:hypothetical protein
MEMSSQLQARRFTPDIHCRGDWLGTRTDLNVTEKIKFSCLCQESNSRLAENRNITTRKCPEMGHPGCNTEVILRLIYQRSVNYISYFITLKEKFINAELGKI